MANIASRSHGATTNLVYDLHHITRSVLHQIGEERSIVDYDQKASTSHGPSFRPPVSSTSVRMQSIRGKGKGRVDRRGHGRDGEGGCGTPEPTLPTSMPLPPHQYLPITRYFHTSPYLPITRYFYTPTNLHITFRTPTHLHIFTIFGVARASFMAVNMTLSSHHLSSPTLPPIDETMIDLVSKLGALPTRRPRAPRICQVLHLSAPSAPSTPSSPSSPSAPFEIAWNHRDQLDVYSRRRPKRNMKTPFCETY